MEERRGEGVDRMDDDDLFGDDEEVTEEPEGNPYANLFDEDSDDPDPQDLAWGLAVPKGWKNKRKYLG